jgi:UDP-2,3-diacylglucosamine hydrolase
VISLAKDTIFISDSHCNNQNKELLNILKKENASMIIFMGDIFDLLFGEISQSIKENQDLINIINEISINKEIIYLEGNHDFNLKKIFPNIKIYPINKQPLIVSYKDKKIALSHGDKNISLVYSLYTSIIRNKPFLFFLNFLNNILNNKILNLIKKSKENKNRCYEINNFKDIVYKKMKYYKEDYIIEGHFHQDKEYIINNKKYINLPAFICSKDIKKIETLMGF